MNRGSVIREIETSLLLAIEVGCIEVVRANGFSPDTEYFNRLGIS